MKLLLLLILCINIVAQNVPSSKDSLSHLINKKSNSSLLESNNDNKDTLFHNGKIIIEPSDDNNLLGELLPSIVAILISLIAILGNYFISHRQLKISQKQFEIQILSTEKTFKEQIDASKQSTDLQFRQNVLSVNRQNWINEFRNVISEISSSIIWNVSKKYSYEKLEEIYTLLTKAELMLNPNDPRDKALIKLLREYRGLFLNPNEDQDAHDKLQEIISSTKVILKSEWERVKKGE